MADPVSDVAARLRAAGCVFAEEEAGLLIAESRTALELAAMVGRRVAGEPLEQVLGWTDFCRLRIAVAPRVFVPRRRTEFLAERAAALARRGTVVVDLCCGTGAVAAAVAATVPGVEVHAVDIDPAAVRCARGNLLRGTVYEGDLYAPLPACLRGRVDLLAANAPYVPSEEVAHLPPEARLHEPRMALDGGSDGLSVHRRIAAGAAEWLAPGGRLLMETSRHQAPATMAACTAAGLTARVLRDDDRDATLVEGGPIRRR